MKKLPERIDVWKFARQGEILEGEVALAKMTRLLEETVSHAESAHIRWQFSVDEGGRALISGHVSSQVGLCCQRCLETVATPLEAEVRLRLLLPGQPEGVEKEGWECIEIADGLHPLATIVEDELLLSLPVVSRHDVCAGNEYLAPDDNNHANAEDEISEEENRKNPFAVLASLKKN